MPGHGLSTRRIGLGPQSLQHSSFHSLGKNGKGLVIQIAPISKGFACTVTRNSSRNHNRSTKETVSKHISGAKTNCDGNNVTALQAFTANHTEHTDTLCGHACMYGTCIVPGSFQHYTSISVPSPALQQFAQRYVQQIVHSHVYSLPQ
jgi:hypothetical protein